MGLEDFRSDKISRQNGDDGCKGHLKVKIDMLKAAKRYGEDFTLSDLKSDEDLSTPTAVKNNTGKTVNELKRKLGLKPNSQKDLSREQVVDELNNLEGEVTTSKINENCSFSATMVREKYGKGSLINALTSLGVKDVNDVKENPGTEIVHKARAQLSKVNQSCIDSDGIVYVIKCIADEVEYPIYYVGMVTYSGVNENRLVIHLRKDGQFHGIVETIDGELKDVRKMNKSITLENAIGFNKSEDETVSDFNSRLSYNERKEYQRIVQEKHQSEVLGGK